MATRTGDKANVVLAQQGSMAHSSNNPGVLCQTPHCGVDINSTSLTVAKPPIFGDLASYIFNNLKDCDAKSWHKTDVH